MKYSQSTILLLAGALLLLGCAQEKNIQRPQAEPVAEPAEVAAPPVQEEAVPEPEPEAVSEVPAVQAAPAKPVTKPVVKPAPQPAAPQPEAPQLIGQVIPPLEQSVQEPEPVVPETVAPETQMPPVPVPVGGDMEMPTFVDPGTREGYAGGIKGFVVDRNGREPVEGARLELLRGAELIDIVTSAQDGSFQILSLPDGTYTLRITAPDYLENIVPVTVNDGYVKNMFNLSLTAAQRVVDVDDDAFGAFDMDDSGYNDNPTILFGSNDVFNNIAGYNFSSVRFRARGYSSESQDVYLAGVRLNDAITGYSPYSLWSGLNEAMRSKETVNGAEISEYGFGGYNGLTNIFGTASEVRKGLRGSIMTNSALYRLRLMASYATGMMDNGWAFAANVSARLGGNDWIDGVYYRSFAYYLAADKKLNDRNMISLVFFGTPGERGAQNSSTQEVYDLVGDNMYNSNWGYQNGKVRNSRVRKTHEPVAILKYTFKPSDKFEGSATVLYRFGKNGYTALDWYDAQDPRPDYYRNLPSYYYGTVDGEYVEDLNRNNPDKYMTAYNVWRYSSLNPDLTHINWDRLYHVNRNQADGRAKYIVQERRTDQRDLNLGVNFKVRPIESILITGGLNARINRTEYFQVVDDLLGGDYFIDMDSFAERDFASSKYKLQNDLDYYLANGAARVLHKGDKYGYDYLAQVRNYGGWISGQFTVGNFSATLGGRVGYDSFWREGLVRKGLFPGTKADGTPFTDLDGNVIPSAKDADGNDITSYGKSKVAGFLTYAAKANLNLIIGGNMRLYANVGWFNDAPKFNQVFLSPRTRNSMVADLKPVKTFSSDINWQFSGSGINVRATAYYTKIWDQSKVMSAYDDIQNAFSNFAITGINQRHMGVELGFKVPTYIVPNLSIQGVLALGEYIYTSTPRMTQTLDNSATIVEDVNNIMVPYWSKTFLNDGSVAQKHYVPSTPQTAVSLGLSYNYNYWFIEADAEYFDRAYLDMNPLYRTDYAVAGVDKNITDEEVLYMTTQEKFAPAFLLNVSVGKSFYIQRKYQLGFSFNAKNLLNNKNVKTGGYEQTRIVDNTVSNERFYRFDSKYFYMTGFNYMLNVYFRF
ncbi:MAG: carboxypeptidase regulatory-like domain-containing protein [Bacteroidales bacterium]|nr:carboxypeptidase regulatory-like domain-containing protein [Bacteroidales bacterium]